VKDGGKDGQNFLLHIDLVHNNNRKIVKIVVSKEGDDPFAVVDVDTLWKRISDRKDFH
jgi:hypothetical protein